MEELEGFYKENDEDTDVNTRKTWNMPLFVSVLF